MRILALGGTQFVGRAFVEAAMANGHHVTVLHRGKNPVPGGWATDEILADRDGGLDALSDRTWDAVYDSCGYVPRVVRASVEALRERCERYLFISTISVFDSDLKLQRPTEPLETEEVTGVTYGPLKVECEDAANEVFGAKATVVRPGLIAGPHDTTGRFPYWVDRFVRFGDVLVPDVPGAPLQQIDARDLGSFCVKLLEDDRGGTFEAAGEPSTFEAMINLCAAQGGGAPVLVPPDLIEANGIVLGSELPLLWAPPQKLMEFDSRESLAAGLKRRSLRETAADTLAWVLTLDDDARSEAKLSRAREEAVITAVRA